MANNVGKIVGGLLIAGATAAVWFWPKPQVSAPADTSVRPVRSALAKEGAVSGDLFFPGRIKAFADRQLAFKRGGRIASIPVKAGEKVKKGTKLAWLVQTEFENAYASAKAQEERDRLACERRRAAAAKNAVSKDEVSQAESQLRQSEIALREAERALEESVIVAPFDGEVSRVPGSEMADVGPGVTVILFHDLSRVKVDVTIPETVAIQAHRTTVDEDDPEALTVSFDSVPGRRFPAQFVEVETTANASTQTFVGTYVFTAPDDLVLLPGMSATLRVKWSRAGADAAKAVTVPESALGCADDGSAFVWVLTPGTAADLHVAHRRTVRVGARVAGEVVVTEGLAAGERVATAGVTVLTEGRGVRLMAE